jgi:hypothetical protein
LWKVRRSACRPFPTARLIAMPVLSTLKNTTRSLRQRIAKGRVLAGMSKQEGARLLEDWSNSLRDPGRFYDACVVYFYRLAPAFLRKHRFYFAAHGRGFGEDAFHVMWWLLFGRYRIERFLEIGVYRGQTLTLAALLQKKSGLPVNVTGVSPFASIGDSVSAYGADVDYYADTLEHFASWSLPAPRLVRALSTAPEADAAIRDGNWDLVYIDGNHDYPVAKADWEAAAAGVHEGGIIVLDDSALFTSYSPRAFASKGHPGPSQVADEIPRESFVEVLRVGHNRVFLCRATGSGAD